MPRHAAWCGADHRMRADPAVIVSVTAACVSPPPANYRAAQLLYCSDQIVCLLDQQTRASAPVGLNDRRNCRRRPGAGI
jgi:hypothetical protein